jgi:hypothetical protein
MATYEPALCQALVIQHTERQLFMIYAADGTILDAIDDDPRPEWTRELVQLPAVAVMPSVWRSWRDNCASVTRTEKDMTIPGP